MSPQSRPTLLSRVLSVAIVATTLACGASAVAGNDPPASTSAASHVDYSAVTNRLKQQFPDLQVDDVRPSPMPALLEIISGHHVFYADTTGSYLFNGKLIDVMNKVDLTAEAVDALSRVDPKTLPIEDSFAEVRGNGRRQLYVFSDPDCPFCKRLEHEFPKLNDVTIHIFLFPLDSIHPNAHANAIQVWCSKDRVKAWIDQMHDTPASKVATCDNPIDRNVALGDKLGFTGTPTIIFPDGYVSAGARPAAEIEAVLAQHQ